MNIGLLAGEEEVTLEGISQDIESQLESLKTMYNEMDMIVGYSDW